MSDAGQLDINNIQNFDIYDSLGFPRESWHFEEMLAQCQRTADACKRILAPTMLEGMCISDRLNEIPDNIRRHQYPITLLGLEVVDKRGKINQDNYNEVTMKAVELMLA